MQYAQVVRNRHETNLLFGWGNSKSIFVRFLKTIWAQGFKLICFLPRIIHVDAIIRQRQQNCQCVFPSTFVVSVFAPAGAAALRRLRKRPPFSARSGEITTGEADGFLWCGSATTPARSAGQRRVWGGNPNKYQTRGTNERSEIWATGRYLLSLLFTLTTQSPFAIISRRRTAMLF